MTQMKNVSPSASHQLHQPKTLFEMTVRYINHLTSFSVVSFLFNAKLISEASLLLNGGTAHSEF